MPSTWPPTAATGQGFQAPTPSEFYQPLIGHGDFAITRPMVVLAISVALIAWFLVATTSSAAVVPSKGQWVTEGVYNFVRNGLARDIIGSHDFLQFVPLLFTLFTLILVNNLFGIIPPVQYPTMSRIGFPIALTLLVFVIYHAVGIRKNGAWRPPQAHDPAGPAQADLRADHPARAADLLRHPSAHAGPATLRQHVRRAPAAAALHHRWRVHADPRQPRPEGRRRRLASSWARS